MQLRKLYTILILVSVLAAGAQENKPKKYFTRFVLGPTISFYSNNSVHTSDTKPRPAFYAGFYEDIKMYNDFSFLPGIEYLYHGVAFNTYYFAPGYQNLYNKHFDYNYRLNMQELRLNLLFKKILGKEDRNLITGYVEYGYVLRYLLNNQLTVNSNASSAEVYSGPAQMSFEHYVFNKNFASALKLTGGMQHNFFQTHRAWFFEVSYVYSLSRVLINNSFSPNSLYINSSFLQLGLGVKF